MLHLAQIAKNSLPHSFNIHVPCLKFEVGNFHCLVEGGTVDTIDKRTGLGLLGISGSDESLETYFSSELAKAGLPFIA